MIASPVAWNKPLKMLKRRPAESVIILSGFVTTGNPFHSTCIHFIHFQLSTNPLQILMIADLFRIVTKIFMKGDILKLVRAPLDKLCQGNIVFTSELYFLSTCRTYAPIQYDCDKLILLKSAIFDVLVGVEWQLIRFPNIIYRFPKDQF